MAIAGGGILAPPFLPQAAPVSNDQVILPASTVNWLSRQELLLPEHSLAEFLARELRPERLENLYQYLWLAGLPIASRTLQQQLAAGRTVFITERVDEHLVWYESDIFIKPLPDYLLCHDFWCQNICLDTDLYHNACGLLLSYSWLVSYRSDFELAKELKLLPGDIDYAMWTRFMRSFLAIIDSHTMAQVSLRYHYGELRRERLDLVSRLLPHRFWSWRGLLFVRGWMRTPRQSRTFFERNFGWILSVFVYISVLLSALQVALGVDSLNGSDTFQAFCRAVALVCMAAVGVVVGAIACVWSVLFWYYVLTTRQADRRIRENRKKRLSGRV